ncbi:MAG TPA: M3 family oligoendopeptidase [Ktedonobacteraceae bacterium]|nr:M3 family oligoendopeptidase [Ktedonobacteraceae bacterium]
MSTVNTGSKLPHWDMTPVYPSLESSEFAQGFAHATRAIADLAQLFDAQHIMQQPSLTVNDALVHTFEAVIARYNSVLDEIHTLTTYIECFVTTNTQDTLAQAKLSELEQAGVILSKLGTRFTAWIGSLDVENLIEQSSVAREFAFMLRRAKEKATHLMTPPEETLAAELGVTGSSAWSKLHSNVTSQITVKIHLRGEARELPMSAIRSLASDEERETRHRAYDAELTGWKQAALPLAAAMNSIKGEVNTLTKKRGWESPLAASLFSNNIDRATLDAMLEAAYESFPDFRRYLHAKAHLLGLPRLAWYDLFAPVGKSTKVWEYEDATNFIVEQFGTFSSRLANFAARAFREQWIDAEPRPGKVDGAFCIPLRKDESRVLANFRPTYEGTSTLAHELGHGYHNLNLAHRPALQRGTPMTLAETASIFCETIVREATLRSVDAQEQLSILEASLQGSSQVVVDITSRFLFEQRVFEKRQQRELSIEELNTLMLDAQRETYGDGLNEAALHPYMWAMKPHYYSTYSFYNYPYMFGLLFGLGLYARYQEDPDTFKKGYDELLSSTGLADAATLAAHFGIDIRSTAFWRSSLDIIRRDIERFEMLAHK